MDGNRRDGKQYPTDVDIIDLLCTKKRRDLIIELKSRRTSDRVVEHISRCLGWIIEETAGDKNVEGLIVNT